MTSLLDPSAKFGPAEGEEDPSAKFGPAEPARDPFADWMQANRVQESPDYDYRGAFEAGEGADGKGHFTDVFKRPSHPTFSTESKYNGQDGHIGGKWVTKGRGRYEFRASEWNLKNMSREQLMDYFDRVEVGNTVRFPDGTSYVGGSAVGPAAPFGDERAIALKIEESQAALDSIVTQTLEVAQRGDANKELEATELANALRMAPSDVAPNLERFRATAKAMRENPRRWRRDNPELFDLITRDPALGPHVMQEVSKWRDVVTPDEAAFAAKHPWLAKLMPSLADELNANPGMVGGDETELKDGDGNVVARKETEQVRMQDMSSMSGNPIMQGVYAIGETFSRSFAEGKISKLGTARAYAELVDPDSETSKSLRQQIAERRAELGAPNYYGDGGVIKAVTGAAGAVAGQTDSMVSLGVGAAIGALTRNPRVGLAITKIAGAITTYGSEMGGSYNELVDTVDDSGKLVDRRVAFAASHVYGALATAVEVGTLGIQAKGISALDARAYARRLVMDQTKRGALIELATTLGKNAASEGGEEGLQQALQLTIQWLGKNFSAGELQRANLPGAMNEIADAAIQGGVGGLLGISLVSTISNAAVALQNIEASRKAGAHVAAIAEVAKTPAAQAAPRHVASWIASQKDQHGRTPTTLYVDPTKLVEQIITSGERAADVARDLMGAEGPQRLQDALDRAGDAPGARATLEVPIAEYLEKWGAKPIAETMADHMTTFAGGQTMDELKLFQGAVEDLADSMADASLGDDEGITAEEAAAQGTLEEQAIAAGATPRAARQFVAQQAAFARVMSKRYGIPSSRFLSPTRLTVQGVGENEPVPQTRRTTAPKPEPTFKGVGDAYDSLIGLTDLTGTADSAYNKWRNSRPKRMPTKDPALRKMQRDTFANWRSQKPASLAGGTLDPVNEYLGLTGDQRVSGVREAFDKLFHRERGTFVQRAREAVRVLRQVQGLEGLTLPDEYMNLDAEDNRRPDRNTVVNFETGENADGEFVLFQGGVNAPASMQAIADAYNELDPEAEGFVTYFADRNTRLMNRRGFEQSFKNMRTHELMASFGFEGAKYFNDEHGHGSVDGALRIMAGVLHEDFNALPAAKIGGDIFVILPDQAAGKRIVDAMRAALPSGGEVTYGGGVKKRKTLQQTLEAASDSLRGVRVVAEKAGSIAPRGQLPAQFRGGQGSPAATAQSLTSTKAVSNELAPTFGMEHSGAFHADTNRIATIYQDPSGLLSDDGFAAAREVNRQAFVMSADIRGFKGMNEAFGREATDAIKAFFNERLHNLGGGAIDMANLHGDEYAAQHENAQAIIDFASAAQAAMREVVIWEKSKDGSYVMQPGIHFAYGVAENEDQADRVELKKFKEQQGPVGEIQRFPDLESLTRGIEAYAKSIGVDRLFAGRARTLVRGKLQKTSGETASESIAEQVARQSVETLEATRTEAELDADAERNLVVIHNATADNIMHAVDELEGALPAPSIGVSRVEQPLTGFGEISLLGDSALIDPKSGVPVFDADVYSPRWPESRFDVDAKKAKALVGSLDKYAQETGNRFMLDTSELGKEDPSDLVNRVPWVEVLGAAYVDEKKIDVGNKERTQDGSRTGQENWARAVRGVVRDSEHQEAYTKWAAAKIKPVLGARHIVKRSNSGRTKRLPYTLENILKEMTKKVRAGEQFNYGLGTARSFGAKRFTSLKQIQKARDRIVDEERFEELRDENAERFNALAEKLGVYRKDGEFSYGSSTSEALVQAIGDSYKRGNSVRAALTRNGFGGMTIPTEVVQEFADFATELVAMPTQYFEAKPQRAVGLNEFKVAVVPSNADPKVVEALKAQGLQVRTYEADESSGSREEARQKATQEAAKELGILFQKNDNDARGWIRIAQKGAERQSRIFLRRGKSDASTLIHEGAHHMFETMEGIAKDPRSPQRLRSDWATLRKHVGATEGAELTEEQKEKLARLWEAYVMEGKAPSASLAEAFYSLSRWLLDIYKSVTKLGVELNDDVRQVFDRMIATDREIEQARAAAGLAGNELRDRSTVAARTQQMIVQGQLRAAKAFKTEEFKKIAKRFADAYDALPESLAWRYMVLGELVMPNGDKDQNLARGKMNRDQVINVLGADSNLVRRLRSRLAKTAGEDIADVAEQFGFVGGGEDMLRRVAALPAKEEWVQQEAEREMRRLHPDIDGEIADLQGAIQKLQHADSYDEAEREWQLIKARTTDQMTLESLMRAAKRMVEEQLVGRIDPGVVLNRERSFAQKATDAMVKGNANEAMGYAHRRLLHKYLYKELMAARDMREAGLDLMADLADDASRERMGKAGPEYRDVIDTILEALNIVGRRQQSEPRKDMGSLMGRMALDGNIVAFDPILVSQIMGQPRRWQELKISEFRAIIDALKNIRAGARNVTSLLRDGKRIDKEQLIAELVAKAEERIKRTKELAPTKSAETVRDKLGNVVDSINALNLRPETVLEELGWTDLLQPLLDAKYLYSDLMASTVKPISDMFDKIPRAIRVRLNETIDGRALFPGHIRQPGAPNKRYHLLMMALHIGNPSNLQRLLGGRNITREQLDAALSLLTAEEWAWVQGVWDQVDSLRPQLFALHERDTGLAPDRIEAKPFTIVTADGKTVNMRGGYFPAAYDSRVSVVGMNKALESIADAMPVSAAWPSTSKSATQKRTEGFEDVISLEPNTIQSHIMRVITDIAFREPIRSTASILLDPRIRQVLVDKLGEERAGMFGPWLRDIARLDAANAEDVGGSVMRWLRYFRAQVPIAVLGHAFDNYLADPLSVLQALLTTELKTRHYAEAVCTFAGDRAKTRAFVLSKSGELRSRSTGEEDFSQFARRMKSLSQTVIGRSEGVIKQHAFYFTELLEKAYATPMWLGAYRQALAQGLSDEDATRFAEGIIRKSLTAKHTMDKAAIQRDKSYLGFVSVFMGFSNLVYNQYRRIWNPVFQAEGTRATTLAATSALMNHFALTLIVGPLAELVVGRGPEPKEPVEEWLLRKMIIANLMPVPLLGGFLESELFGKSGASNRSNPGFAALEQIFKAFKTAADDDGDGFDALLAFMKAYGYVRGVPVLRLTRMLQYLLEGDFDNVGGVASGVLYGEREKGQADNLIKMTDRALE